MVASAPETHAPETRARIRQVAEHLYVLRGHDGFSFGDVAAAVGTTRANIHHHFGSKRRLMEDLVPGFADDAAARIAGIWGVADHGFTWRMTAQTEDLRRFHRRFNPGPGDRNVWSPVSRIRLDLPALGDLGRLALERVNAAYQGALHGAVTAAVGSGEMRPGTPVDDVVRLLRATFLSCGPITQDAGSFTEVERLLTSLDVTIRAAYGV